MDKHGKVHQLVIFITNVSGKGAKLARLPAKPWTLVPRSVNTVPNKIVVYVILILSFSCSKARMNETSALDF